MCGCCLCRSRGETSLLHRQQKSDAAVCDAHFKQKHLYFLIFHMQNLHLPKFPQKSIQKPSASLHISLIDRQQAPIVVASAGTKAFGSPHESSTTSNIIAKNSGSSAEPPFNSHKCVCCQTSQCQMSYCPYSLRYCQMSDLRATPSFYIAALAQRFQNKSTNTTPLPQKLLEVIKHIIMKIWSPYYLPSH